MKVGTRVRMSEILKITLLGNCTRYQHNGPLFEGECYGCSRDHLQEFEYCIGIVEGPVNYNCYGDDNPKKFGPEIDVRWQPSNLRYAYHPKDLEVVDDDFR